MASITRDSRGGQGAGRVVMPAIVAAVAVRDDHQWEADVRGGLGGAPDADLDDEVAIGEPAGDP